MMNFKPGDLVEHLSVQGVIYEITDDPPFKDGDVGWMNYLCRVVMLNVPTRIDMYLGRVTPLYHGNLRPANPLLVIALAAS